MPKYTEMENAILNHDMKQWRDNGLHTRGFFEGRKPHYHTLHTVYDAYCTMIHVLLIHSKYVFRDVDGCKVRVRLVIVLL